MKYYRLNDSEKKISGLQRVKQSNMRRVFDIIRFHKGASRAYIAEVTNLTRATTSSLVDDLIDLGLVIQTGEGESVTGRKPIMLDVNPDGCQIPVLAFRPSGILYTLFDLRGRVIENSFRAFPDFLKAKFITGEEEITYRDSDGIAYLEGMLDVLHNAASKLEWEKVSAVCISMPGTFIWNEGTFTSSVLQVRTSTRFIEELHRRLNYLPILAGNSSEFLAYAENCVSVNKMGNLFFFNISHGVGSGVIIEDRMLQVPGGLVGEVGHISVDINGRRCFCGNRGCVERYVNQDAIINAVVERIQNGEDSMIGGMCNYNFNQITIKMLAAAAEAGDELVNEELKKVAGYLSIGISNAVCTLGVSNVVLGGGIEDLGPIFLGYMKECMRNIGYRRMMDRVRVSYTRLDENGESFGAARQWLDTYLQFGE